jgi:hypothetical protein
MLTYHEDQIYAKTIHRDSTLDPYDRGGIPFTRAEVKTQYPANSPTVGFVTAYLTPFSWFLANTTPYLGTTIVAHPGGILDEILYITGGLIRWSRQVSSLRHLPSHHSCSGGENDGFYRIGLFCTLSVSPYHSSLSSVNAMTFINPGR